jgi:hypothetical protein
MGSRRTSYMRLTHYKWRDNSLGSHQEFIRLLNTIGGHRASSSTSSSTIQRFTFHFTPTSYSWLSAVETFLATLTRRRLKRGIFLSVVDLQAAINRYLEEANHDPKPFVWAAEPGACSPCMPPAWEGYVRVAPLETATRYT